MRFYDVLLCKYVEREGRDTCLLEEISVCRQSTIVGQIHSMLTNFASAQLSFKPITNAGTSFIFYNMCYDILWSVVVYSSCTQIMNNYWDGGMLYDCLTALFFLTAFFCRNFFRLALLDRTTHALFVTHLSVVHRGRY